MKLLFFYTSGIILGVHIDNFYCVSGGNMKNKL